MSAEPVTRVDRDPPVIGIETAQETVLGTLPVAADLVARRPPEGVAFGARILLADDGTDASEDAVVLAASVAAAQGTDITLVYAAGPITVETRRRQAENAAFVRHATGIEPVMVTYQLPPLRAILQAARDLRSSLVVVGAHALADVGGRVAEQAPCSVLVARR